MVEGMNASRLPVAPLRIEHRLQLVNQKCGVTALAEYRGNDPGQRHDPLEMIEILRVDEHLEWPALLMRSTFVELMSLMVTYTA